MTNTNIHSNTKSDTSRPAQEQAPERLADWGWALRAGLIAAFIAGLVLIGKDGISATPSMPGGPLSAAGDAPELPPEWRWEARQHSFDRMFRSRTAAAPWVCRSEAQCRRNGSRR